MAGNVGGHLTLASQVISHHNAHSDHEDTSIHSSAVSEIETRFKRSAEGILASRTLAFRDLPEVDMELHVHETVHLLRKELFTISHSVLGPSQDISLGKRSQSLVKASKRLPANRMGRLAASPKVSLLAKWFVWQKSHKALLAVFGLLDPEFLSLIKPGPEGNSASSTIGRVLSSFSSAPGDHILLVPVLFAAGAISTAAVWGLYHSVLKTAVSQSDLEESAQYLETHPDVLEHGLPAIDTSGPDVEDQKQVQDHPVDNA